MKRMMWVFLAALLLAPTLRADPCGMVPPIVTQDDPDKYLTREGDQITYVFFKNGIQDIVLQPAFRGKVSEFGMLIPFPTPPEIRKVSDDIFPQVAKAVDPPELTIRVSPPRQVASLASADMAPMAKAAMPAPLMYSEVRVLKEEAVGMYQVAVLEAGSAEALGQWMTKHRYIYPNGMDTVVGEYVGKKWCFVAVKARVGNKKGVEPKPGMKETSPDLPEDATFSGAVQAMGFRYRVEKPVVPMRLSAFNPGPLYNIVYALADEGVRFEQLPGSMVETQIPGEELLKNMTELLRAKFVYPEGRDRITVHAARGEQPDLPSYLMDNPWNSQERWNQERDPAPHNAKAKDLIASDLLAARHGRLIHPFEEKQKALLNIGEELGFRGAEVDALIHKELEAWRQEALMDAVQDLKGMTMTVIKGDFPREVLRKDDLTFLGYMTPTPWTPPTSPPTPYRGLPLLAMGVAIVTFIIFFFAVRKRRHVATGLILAIMAGAASAQETSIDGLVLDLGKPDKRDRAMEKLIQQKAKALPVLHRVIKEPLADLEVRGWAIICTARIGDRRSGMDMANLLRNDPKPLVRLWAAGAMAEINAEDALPELLPQIQRTPFWRRNPAAGGDLTAATQTFILKKVGPKHPAALIRTCLRAGAPGTRQLAASFLGSAGVDSPETRRRFIEAAAYDSKAKLPPWQPGPLFIPGVAWTPIERRALTAELLHWMIALEADSRQSPQIRILQNNLRALGLATGRFRATSFTLAWVDQWGRTSQHPDIEGAARLLIHLLESGEGDTILALQTLQETTGEDLGSDPKDWRAWLEKRQK